MGQLNQLRWPSLAQDLAIMLLPGSPITSYQMIYDAYGITEQELLTIMKIPRFGQLFKEAVDYFKAKGDKATLHYRASSLSFALAEQLFENAMTGKLDSKDAIKLLELLYRACGAFNTDAPQVNTQVNVGVALPLPNGLSNPKIRHLEAANGADS